MKRSRVQTILGRGAATGRRGAAAALVLWLCGCPAGAPPGPVPAAPRDGGRGEDPQSPVFVVVRPAAGVALPEAPARVLLAPESIADVVPPFRARVVRIHARPGQRLLRGAPVLDVVMPDVLRAAGAYVAASTRLSAYGKRKAQLDSLRGEGLVRLADLAEVEGRLAEAMADQQAALGLLRGADLTGADAARLLTGPGTLTLRSPIAGVVTEVRATLGETHENSDLPLAHIAGEGELRVEARLSGPLPPGARLEFASATGLRCALTLLGVAPVVDPRDGSTLAWLAPAGRAGAALPPLRAEAPAADPPQGAGCPEALPPGLSGRLRISLERADGVVVVPVRALWLRGQVTAVLRRAAAGGSATRRVPVQVLATAGDLALVRESAAEQPPLRADDEVVQDASLVSEDAP